MSTLNSKPRLDREHGSPYDRGSADSWYQRPRNPHYFVGGSYKSEPITEELMTPEQVKEYHKGYDANVAFKDWGDMSNG